MSRRRGKKTERKVDESIVVPVLQLGDEVPNFVCDSTTGMFNLHDIVDGSFAVIITFARDFDPVGTTEIGMLAKLKDEFEARDVKVVAIGVDSKSNHRKWIEEIQELQDCEVYFPIIADQNAEISRVFGLVKPQMVNAKKNLRPATLTMVLDVDKRIRMMTQYPSSTGRNFYETVRAVDTMQLHLYHQVVCPANWANGEEVFVNPTLGSGAAAAMFPKGFNEMKSWYRPTVQPDAE
mmetsp:Transcript_98807/g.282504  ORF Transcript_98807/g.282504 Transcript_98807/m.282504 type:complete len:236 (+) Transcript_98807:201-908(+)